MRRLLLAAVLLPAAAAAQPAPITGRWITEDRAALVEVAPCGPALCGRIVRVLKRDPSKPITDVHNPDAALRNRPIVGLAFLTGFVADRNGWNGRIYDPRNGRSYRSVLTRTGGMLKVKGCLGPFCRTQTWTRAG